jgi:hypothetical protein
MGYSCIAKPGFWSSFSNQASLTFQQYPAAGINYENRFGIIELGTRTAGLILPAGRATLGGVYRNFGYRYFSRHSAGIACGMKLSEKLSAGVQADYFYERTPGEGTRRSSLTFEAGVLVSAGKNTTIGFRIFNPVPGSFRKNWLPSSITTGAEIRLNRLVSATADAELSTGGKARFSIGFEYLIVKNLQIRGGYGSGGSVFCFGIGYKMKSVKIDMGFILHERLGMTSSASLIYELRN